MKLSSSLQKLKSSLSCCEYNGAQHTFVLIKEGDRKAALTSIKIAMDSGDWFAFFPDKGRGEQAVMSPLLACEKEFDHHRACDCVIVKCQENNLTVLYIDLKSGNPRGYENQFKSTRQFVRYALELLKEFHEISLKLNREEYIVFYGGDKLPSIRKKGSALSFKKINTSPNNAYKRAVRNNALLNAREFFETS